MNRRKSLILIAMVVLLLTFTVSGTIAWLAASTDSVENVFTPGKIKTDIDEEFSTTAKTSIVVKNDAEPTSTVSVFVRVAVNGYYVKDITDSEGNVTGQEIVEPWDGKITIGTDWFEGSDGFYYYKKAIAPGASTSDLLGADITLTKGDDGKYLVVNVLHQSIQADGMTTDENDNTVPVVTAEWGVIVNTDQDGNKTISKN